MRKQKRYNVKKSKQKHNHDGYDGCNQYELHTAKERRTQACPIQLQNYLREIQKAAEAGRESCYLLSGSEYNIRQEHIDILLASGYDLIVSGYGRSIFHDRTEYSVKCYFTEDASGQITSEYK